MQWDWIVTTCTIIDIIRHLSLFAFCLWDYHRNLFEKNEKDDILRNRHDKYFTTLFHCKFVFKRQ